MIGLLPAWRICFKSTLLINWISTLSSCKQSKYSYRISIITNQYKSGKMQLKKNSKLYQIVNDLIVHDLRPTSKFHRTNLFIKGKVFNVNFT